MWVTHGSLSLALAEIACSIGSRRTYAFIGPPGIKLGPHNAPSSPPEMPMPTNMRLAASTSFERRSESVKSELPPSMIMSPS